MIFSYYRNFYILDFHMNLYTFEHQGFHILEFFIYWKCPYLKKFHILEKSLTCHIFVPCQRFNTQVCLAEDNTYIVKYIL